MLVDIKARAGARRALLAHPARVRRHTEDRVDRAGEARCIVRLDKEPGLPVLQPLGNGAHARSDHRRAARKRLDAHEAEGLGRLYPTSQM